MKKPLKVNVHVVTKSGVIAYDSLSPEEKRDLGIRLNRRAVQAAARAEGYVLEFEDTPSERDNPHNGRKPLEGTSN